MYEFTEIMGEISGFGGSYEAGCRAMLKAGLEWWDSNPSADPKFQGFEGVYGLITETNEDAKALTEAVMDAEVNHPEMSGGKPFKVGSEATGAMHHAVISHILFIRAKGWDEYTKQMSEKK